MRHIIICILFFTVSTSLLSQAIARKAEIKPLNRAVIYFSSIPEYTYEQSADKRKITIKTPLLKIEEDAKNVSGSGIIEGVYLNNSGNEGRVSIVLKEPRGFTITSRPYSNSLVAEVFKWDALEKADDNYRLGQLALYDSLYEDSEKMFRDAALAFHPDASVEYALLKLRTGNIDFAEELLTAVADDAKNDDAWAALAQISQLKSDTENFIKYDSLFRVRTGLKEYSMMLIDYSKLDSGLSTQFANLIAKFSVDTKPDTVRTVDSLAESEEFGNLFANDTSKEVVSEYESISSTLINYAIIFLAGLFILVIYLYVKWRNEQINQKNKPSPAFAKRLEEAKIAEKLAAQQRSMLVNEKKKSKDEEEREKYMNLAKTGAANKPKTEEKKGDQKEKKADDENDEIQSEKDKRYAEFGKMIERIKQEKIEEIDLTNEEEEPGIESHPAKLEMAMNLAEEQKRLKEKSLRNLAESRIKAEPGKLSEIAKKLGIEKGSVEVKSKMDEIDNDSGKLSKLAEKFSVKKGNDRTK